MARKKHKTEHEVSDESAAEALRGGSQYGPMPTHSSMDNEPDADETDAAEDDGDWDEQDKGC